MTNPSQQPQQPPQWGPPQQQPPINGTPYQQQPQWATQPPPTYSPTGYPAPQPPHGSSPVGGKPPKKPLYKRWWFLALAGFLMFWIIAAIIPDDPQPTATVDRAPAPAPAAPAAPEFAGLGDTVAFETSDAAGTITLNNVERQPGESALGASGQPKNADQFLIAEFTVEVTEGTLHVNPFNFKAADEATGNTVEYDVFTPAEKLNSADVSAGRKVTGALGFDVPEGPVIIDYSPSLFGGPLASFRVEG